MRAGNPHALGSTNAGWGCLHDWTLSERKGHVNRALSLALLLDDDKSSEYGKCRIRKHPSGGTGTLAAVSNFQRATGVVEPIGHGRAWARRNNSCLPSAAYGA